MTQFDNREKAFESKYAHDQELAFKVMARRNKLLGLWAAGEMGLSGDAAAEYAKDVVKSDFQEAGDDDVFRKVKADLDAKQVAITDHRLRKEMEDLLVEAKRQVMEELQ
ncbi:DUF1476 domain-containing protein [Iodidimonas sp. SYSU 1G8]|uniref:DUF1476 domain-containing protein n=1 Tax=Iodidimonas sp. SYSU 1G8 TaxID=3133967 RepID=UPI0031FE4A71